MYTTPDKKHYSVAEQKQRLPLYLQEFYETRQLDRIKIDGTEIQGYFEYSFIQEKTYVKSPERSSGGQIDNLNSYSTFLTPRLVIKYNYMHIGDYRKLMQIINSKNEFVVECYDIVLDKRVTHNMYFAPTEMPSIHQRYLEILGVKDYTIELIGTNTSFDIVEVRYYDENRVLIPEATQTVDKGTEAVINYNYIPALGKRFDGLWKTSLGVPYANGSVINILNDDLELYAETVPDTQFTLSFNYGNGNTLYSQTTGAINNITINNGETINAAILRADIILDNGTKFEFPSDGTGGLSVLYEDEYIVPYKFKGWYWTPNPYNDIKVDGSTVFNYALNRTIYQIYEPIEYNVSYQTNKDNITFDTQKIAYGSKVPLPALRTSGFTFIGWYLDSEFKTAFNGTMPPKDISLYAKWEENK